MNHGVKSMRRRILLLVIALVCVPSFAAQKPKSAPTETCLYDFEDPADLKAWSNLELPDARHKEPPARR